MGETQDVRDPMEWVRTGQRVEARTDYGDVVHATGTVVAYAAHPTVLIQTDSGEQVHWAVHLTRPINDPCGEPTDALVHQAYCTKPADHYGERHTADIGGGSFTWGYLPTPEEASRG